MERQKFGSFLNSRIRGLVQRKCPVRLISTIQKIQAVSQNPSFLLQFFFIVSYRLALDVLYLTVISPQFNYMGFTTRLLPLYYFCTLLAVFVFSPFILRLQEDSSPSSSIVAFLCYIYFIPLTSYCGCKGASLSFFLIALVYWTFLLFFQFQFPFFRLTPPATQYTRRLYTILTAFSCIFVMFISGRYTRFRFTLNFIDVYGIRAEAGSYQMPGIFTYLLSMMGVALAILLLYWLRRKKWGVVALLIIVYLFMFSIAAHKSLFFFLLILLAAYYLYRPWMMRFLPALLTLAAIAALMERKITHTFYLATLFFRRLMFVPVNLGEVYMTFFQENPLNLFREGIMGKIVPVAPTYSVSLAKIIGESLGWMTTYCNNGLLGDMFANLPPLLGMILLPLILIICFRLLDAVSLKLPQKFLIPICIYFSVCFSNSSWSTVLLSHGFLITCLLLYFFPRKEISAP